MDRFRILYVYGLGSSPESGSIKLLRESLPANRYEVLSVTYPQEDCEASVRFIQEYIAEQGIDLVIGSSLGGFIVSNLECDIPRILLNPCMEPMSELPRFGIPEELAQSYRKRNDSIWNHNRSGRIYGLFAENDEVLGDKYRRGFQEHYGDYSLIPSGHKLSPEAVPAVIETIERMLG